ncbi:MAG: ATP-dependent zinc metalloprotease FtsH [Bacteroidales bacterium]|nr:ATP-dependent zinc metalloprotease FtsH [Bacteroidales bacterium]
MEQNNKNNPKNTPKTNKPKFNIYWIYGGLFVLFLIINFYSTSTGSLKEIQWQKVEQIIKHGDLKEIVVVNRETAEIYLKSESIQKEEYKDASNKKDNTFGSSGAQYYYTILSMDDFVQKWDKINTEVPEENRAPLKNETREDIFGNIFWNIFPFIIIIVIWIFIFRRMGGAGSGGSGSGIFSIGKSKAKEFNKETDINVNFNDVAGLEEAKVEIKEIVDFLKNPKKYTDLGGKIPKGALLVGPPGTGKTLLAKAVAGEAHVPFFSMSGSDFVEMFVGVGASRVRDLFKKAKEKSPCIIFIDEIDAIGRARGNNPNMGANDERENTLNQLLTEMDGFGTNSGVIILAATNRADILDKALLRAGRFDRQIHVELPDIKERQEIFKVHLKPLKSISTDITPEFLAKQTPGFSGADIANVCNEAALIAARKDKKKVEKQDVLDAIDRIVGGLEKKNKIITKNEKRAIAYHEAGHATVSWLIEYANPLIKVTIIPRGRALGAAWYLPEERQITTKDQILDEMCATLGGRASEEVNFGKVSTGALNDLEKVTKQAYALITYYGMSTEVGHLSFYDSTGQSAYNFTKPYSEKTSELIDVEVKKIIDEQYQRALKLLNDNKEGLVALGERLMEKEVIFTEDLEEIFGKRQWTNRSDELESELFTEEQVQNTEEIIPEEIPTEDAKIETPEEDNKIE